MNRWRKTMMMMMMMMCDCQQEGESSVPGGQGQCNGPDYDLRKINATQRPKKKKNKQCVVWFRLF
jgi:hypothetical protein